MPEVGVVSMIVGFARLCAGMGEGTDGQHVCHSLCVDGPAPLVQIRVYVFCNGTIRAGSTASCMRPATRWQLWGTDSGSVSLQLRL